MDRINELIAQAKLVELFRKQEVEKPKNNTLLIVLAIVGGVAAISLIAFAVYRFFTPDYLEDFEEDFDDDDFDEYFVEDEK